MIGPHARRLTPRGTLLGSALLLASTGLQGAHAQTSTPGLSLKRDSLTSGTATGHPDGGSYTYMSMNPAAGGTVGTLGSPDAGSNPNMLSLPDPANPTQNGRPSPGGFGSYTVTYTVNGTPVLNSKDDPFQIPTFGMSCYFTTLESDWGAVGPTSCKSVKIKGTVYSGTVDNPDSYKGKFCASFIAEVRLQGSGVTDGGKDIQYSAGVIRQVSSIKTADGTPPVANMTLARSRDIIPAHGVHVSADGVGDNLLANDTGGAIVGYRLDYYKGVGKQVCAGYVNVMAISACKPSQPHCAGYAFPTGD